MHSVIEVTREFIWNNKTDKFSLLFLFPLKVGLHDPISIQLILKIFVCMIESVDFTRSSFWIQLFREELGKIRQFLFWEFHA